MLFSTSISYSFFFTAHPECAHLDDDCCPTKSGAFLDCCLDDQTAKDLDYPDNPDVATCAANALCDIEGRDGDCCPTDDGTFLFCCENYIATCDAHPKCAAENLAGPLCCPTADNVYLDCCERDFSQCAAHPECSHLDGECCPTTSGQFLSCCLDDTADNMDFETEPDAGSCAATSACSNLEGACCPTVRRKHGCWPFAGHSPLTLYKLAG
jgi:hypothetical protein